MMNELALQPWLQRLLLFFVSLYCVSCGQRMDECVSGYSLSGAPSSFVLVGYTLTDADTILIEHFGADTTFSQPQRTDTLFLSNAVLNGDTVFSGANRATMGWLEIGKAYKITLPSISKSHRIWDITYHPSAYITGTYLSENCPNGTPVAHPRLAKSDGPIGTIQDQFGLLILCLVAQ